MAGMRVIEDLILDLAGAVINSAVAVLGYLPIKAQLEVIGDQLLFISQRSFGSHTGESTVLDVPVSTVFPAIEGLAIGERDKAEVFLHRLKRRGELRKGYFADVTVFDPNREWVFERSDTASKSTNNPFYGWPLKGQTIMTIVRGKTVWMAKPATVMVA